MIDRNIIGQRITALRKAHNLTQSELADRLGVTHQAVSQWERNETLPDILILPKLAEIFGETTDHFLGLTEDMAVSETNEEPVPEEETETTDVAEESAQTDAEEKEEVGKMDTWTKREQEDTPERSVYVGSVSEDRSYTVVLVDSCGNATEVPVGMHERVRIVLEGSCADLVSKLSVTVEGDVSGDITSGPLTVGGDVGGDLAVNGCTSVGGDVGGDINCGALTVEGDVDGDVKCGALMVNGCIDGDVECGPLTVNGDIAGDVECGPLPVNGDVSADAVECDALTVNGNVDGDICCNDGTVTVNGDHDGGDINAAFAAITGDIGGDVNTDCAILCGDVDGDFSGKRTIVTDAQSIPWEAILSAVIERDVDKLRQYFAK